MWHGLCNFLFQISDPSAAPGRHTCRAEARSISPYLLINRHNEKFRGFGFNAFTGGVVTLNLTEFFDSTSGCGIVPASGLAFALCFVAFYSSFFGVIATDISTICL